MPKRRDRHGRGIRGPLARPNPLTGSTVPIRRRPANAEFFLICLDDAMARVQERCPGAMARVDIGVEDVPSPDASWANHQVPLAVALEPTPEKHGQIVLFRRPLERRAQGRKELRRLVYRTVVEQLAAVTGFTVDDIDPSVREDWD